MSSARFEIVRTDAPQPWHARFRSANGRVVWTTENYTRRTAALAAIESMALEFGYRVETTQELSGSQRRLDLAHAIHPSAGWGIKVRDIDERYTPQPVVLEPPFYLGEITEFVGEGRAKRVGRVPFWHDRDYHWRHCYGDECTEGTPPAGTSVRGRTGSSEVTS